MRPLSLVVVTWNSADELRALIASVERELRSDYEIVVIDNASNDDTARVAEAHAATEVVLLDENVGFGAASNMGVRRARHDAVILLNPDTELIDGSLRHLADLAVGRGALCGPEILNSDRSRQPSASSQPAGWEVGLGAVLPARLLPQRLRNRCEPWRAERTITAGWLTGACIAAPRRLLLALGPFDERIHLFAEDMDLGIRARQAGISSLFAPQTARIIHHGDRSSSKRFPDSGLSLRLANRHLVLSRRLGARRAAYDFVCQFAFHSTRLVAKAVIGRQFSRERRWFSAVLRHARIGETE